MVIKNNYSAKPLALLLLIFVAVIISSGSVDAYVDCNGLETEAECDQYSLCYWEPGLGCWWDGYNYGTTPPPCSQTDGEYCDDIDIDFCCIEEPIDIGCNVRINKCNVVCGSGYVEESETCDTGSAVGQECTLSSPYDYNTGDGIISCQYCASNCGGWITKEAGYCGDGDWQSEYEGCEGNEGISGSQWCDNNCEVQGGCVPNHQCPTLGVKQCSGNNVQECVMDAQDCSRIWSIIQTCSSPDICSGGSCVCIDESWSATCSGKCGTQTNNCGNSVSCNPCTTCPNGACDNGETCSSCSADCGSCCGNGVCDNGETSTSCPADCPVNPYCGDGVCNNGETYATCPEDCDEPVNCELTSAAWSAESVTENEQVQLIVNGNNCDGATISFEVYENDLLGDDLANVQPNNAIFSSGVAVGTWTAEWQEDTSGDPEYYFEASVTGDTIKSSKPELVTTQDTSYCLTTPVDLCGDYTSLGQSKCELDSCGAIDDSIPEGVDCESPGVNCACTWRWETSECSASYSSGEIGTCYLQETGQEDNCDDGILSYAWTATWEWNEGNFVTDDPESNDYIFDSEEQGWRYDPLNPFVGLRKSEQCTDGKNTIACPAQIQLSFFDKYNFLIAIVLIVLIYLIIAYKNNRKTKKKNVRKRKKR